MAERLNQRDDLDAVPVGCFDDHVDIRARVGIPVGDLRWEPLRTANTPGAQHTHVGETALQR